MGLTLLAVVALTLWNHPAEASLFMSLSDGTTTVSCTNPPTACGAGWSTPSANIMSFTGTVGSYSVAMSSTATNNPGTAVVAEMDSSNTAVSRATFSGLTTLTILISQTGYSAPTVGLGFLGNTGSASFAASLAGDNYTVESWVDKTNTLHTSTPTAGPGITSNGPCTITSPGGTVGSAACTNPFVSFGNMVPFSLTEKLTFSISPSATSSDAINSTDATTVNATNPTVPEPGSLVLLGIGLLTITYRFRRRI
jgi:hypothetical protein